MRKRVAVLGAVAALLTLGACDQASEPSGPQGQPATFVTVTFPPHIDDSQFFSVSVLFAARSTSVEVLVLNGPNPSYMECGLNDDLDHQARYAPNSRNPWNSFEITIPQAGAAIECAFDSSELGFVVRRFPSPELCGKPLASVEPLNSIPGQVWCSSDRYPEAFEARGIHMAGSLIIET